MGSFSVLDSLRHGHLRSVEFGQQVGFAEKRQHPGADGFEDGKFCQRHHLEREVERAGGELAGALLSGGVVVEEHDKQAHLQRPERKWEELRRGLRGGVRRRELAGK